MASARRILKRSIIALPALAIMLILSCGRNPSGRESLATKVYSDTELGRLIVPGMSVAEVSNRFGPAASVTDLSGNRKLLMYTFPLDAHVRSIAGFDVEIKDGAVVSWSPILSGGTPRPTESPQTFAGVKRFEMFIASEEITNALAAFDSGTDVDTSKWTISPGIVFHAQVFVGAKDGGKPAAIPVRLVLLPDDASKLLRLTENNFGRRTLLVCSNKVLATPLIKEPISSPQFTVTIKEQYLKLLTLQ